MVSFVPPISCRSSKFLNILVSIFFYILNNFQPFIWHRDIFTCLFTLMCPFAFEQNYETSKMFYCNGYRNHKKGESKSVC